MANIQEYNSQVEAQNPVGGTSPNLELSGAVGRSLENLGGTLEQGFGAVHRAKIQEESTSIYSGMSDVASVAYERYNQQLQDGTLDKDKFIEEFDRDSGKIAEGISTRQGMETFERQRSRVRASLLHKAITGQAALAGLKAKQDTQNFFDNTSNNIFKGADFQTSYESAVEFADDMQKNHGLSEKDKDALIMKAGQDFTVAALRSVMKKDPDEAKRLLDSDAFKTKDGKSFLSAKIAEEMDQAIERTKRAKEYDMERADRLIERAQKKKDEAWGQANFNALEDASLGFQEINDAVEKKEISVQMGKEWTHLLRTSLSQQNETKPEAYNEIAMKIASYQYTDPSQFVGRVGKDLSVKDYKAFVDFMKDVPGGKDVMNNRKLLLESARTQLLKKDALGNFGDAAGNAQKNLADFTASLQQRENEYRKEGKSVADLYNPKSPDYFGNELVKYKKQPKQVFEEAAKQKIQQQQAQIEAQKSGEEEVEVVNVETGQVGTIKKSKLAAALASKKYRQKQ